MTIRRHTGRVQTLRFFGAALALVAALVIAPPAFGQIEDEITIDPDSPSGIEYDIPFESARRSAGPGGAGGGAVVRGSRSAPAFGEGITPRASAARGGNGGARPRRERRARRTMPLPPEVVTAAAQPAAPSGSTGATLLYAALGAVIVAVGALLGLLLRRRRPE
jgi:hypothetical protein